MNKVAFVSLLLLLFSTGNAQELKFDQASPFFTQEDKSDKTISIPFSLEKATKDCDVSFDIVEEKSSATKDKDYSIKTNSPIKLTKGKKFSDKLELMIKADNFTETQENLILKFKFKNEKGEEKEIEYTILINDLNDGGENEPNYTSTEKEIMRNLSIDIFTGGNFDFFEKIKIKNVGGEFVVSANNIAGKFGGYLGISNFQNISFDSSNKNVRTQYIRIDTGAYINGTTRYVQRTFVDHRKISTSQWSYYVNPTYRLNQRKSDFFNIYLSLRLESLQTSTKTEFQTDTISFSDTTNRPLGNNPVFQSGKGFLLQKVTDIASNGFFSIGFPMYINAKNKYKLYFDPNIGICTYNYTTYLPTGDQQLLSKTTTNVTKLFYLFRTRITEQVSGINITVGGEVRGLAGFNRPQINTYLGLRANISKWFSKDNATTTNN